MNTNNGTVVRIEEEAPMAMKTARELAAGKKMKKGEQGEQLELRTIQVTETFQRKRSWMNNDTINFLSEIVIKIEGIEEKEEKEETAIAQLQRRRVEIKKLLQRSNTLISSLQSLSIKESRLEENCQAIPEGNEDEYEDEGNDADFIEKPLSLTSKRDLYDSVYNIIDINIEKLNIDSDAFSSSNSSRRQIKEQDL